MQKRAYRGFFSILSGSLLGQIIVLLTTPIITRLYSPSDFGVFSLYLAVVSLVVVISTLKFEYAIPLPKETEKAINLVVSCLVIVFVMSIGSILTLILISDFLKSWKELSVIFPYLWLISLSILGGGIYSTFNYWAIRDKSYSDIAKTKFNQSLASSSGKIILGFFGVSPLGLMVGDFFSRIAGSITLIRLFFKKNRSILNSISWHSMIQVSKEYYRFPLYSCPSSLINTLAFQMPALLLISYYSPDIAGYYSLACGIMVLPTSLISEAVGQVYLGEMAEHFHKSSAFVKKLYLDVICKLLIISIPPILIIAITAPYIFPIIFGNIWGEAGFYCIALASTVITQFVFSTTSILHYCGKNNWVLLFDICRTAIIFCVFFICVYLEYSAFITLVMYSAIMSVMYIVNYFMNLKAIACITDN